MTVNSWTTGWRAWVSALLWSALIFGLSSIPGRALPDLSGWWNADKFVHTGVYAVLGALCWFGARGTLPPGRGPRAQVFVAFLCTTLYGVTDEAHQSFTPMRSPDAWDVLADAIGGLLGALGCVAFVSYRRVRK